MNEENTRKLLEEFPLLYAQRDLPMTESLMCFGFECGDGWFDLLHRLSAKIEAWNRENSSDDTPAIEAQQVKEKYGGLRFYISGGAPPEIEKAISDAEAESYKTCEDCGASGKPNRGGWISTLCKKCRAKGMV